MLRALLASSLVLALLSGCLSSEEPAPAGVLSSDLEAPSEERSAAVVAQAEAGEPVQARESSAAPQPHGEAQRVDGDVEVAQDATGMWHAKRTTTITNGVAGLRSASVAQDLFRGTIQLTAADAGAYVVEASLDARGATEQLARDALERLDLMHTDTAEADRLVLDTWVEEGEMVDLPAPLGSIHVGTLTDWSATFTTTLPAHLAYDLAADVYAGELAAVGFAGGVMAFGSYSGAIKAEQLRADELVVDTYSGSIQVAKSTAARLTVDTYSGAAEVDGVFDTFTADTYSGAIQAKVAPAASGTYTFDAYSGTVDVALGQADGQAYDIVADSYSGSVDVDVAGTQDVADDEADQHVRSTHYEGAAIKVDVLADTYSGGIRLHG